MQTILVALAVGAGVSIFANVCTTVYLHRALSHRALTLHPAVDQLFRFCVWITTGIRPRQWVAVHRKHHAFTDVEGDPHSPKLLGWGRVQLTNAALYRREARNPATVARYSKDLSPDWWDRNLFDRAWLGLALGITFLIVLLGPVWGLVAAAVHMVGYLAMSGAVNAVGHHFGRRPYDNAAGNLLWLALLTGGEGFHNNHHAAPTSARLGHKWGQIDFGWYFIALSKKVGLATVRLERLTFAPTKDRVAA